MDDFEKNIRENKGFFEEPAPDKMKMWENISAQLPQVTAPKVIPLWKRAGFRIAAGLVLLVGLTIFFTTKNINRSPNQASSEYLEVNNYYGKLVALQISKLKNSSLSAAEKDGFLEYIDELNQEQALLKKELEENLDNEVVLEAIVKNFNQQIELIEHLLDRLNQTKSKKDETGISL